MAAGLEAGNVDVNSFKQKYTDSKIKILIVPGHDKEFFGTQFKTIKEETFNLQLATELYDYFKTDSHFETYITRDQKGYLSVFQNYFTDKKESIEKFIALSNDWFENLYPDFQWVDGVDHNVAKKDVALRLFGINVWANDNNIDLVIHVHFNDYGGRKKNRVGEYSGFSIYVPEKQLNNSFLSMELARTVFPRLEKLLPVSDIPKENVGIVEDQQLIAIGPKNTLSAASMLVEYGYIYDSYALNKSIRALFFKELARQTYLGVKQYFDSDNGGLYPILGVYQWKSNLVYGLKNNKDVLFLQLALAEEGVYPPKGYTLKDCPITGNFLKCTKSAIKQFQEKYGDEILNLANLDSGTGVVGKLTLKKLNSLYSND